LSSSYATLGIQALSTSEPVRGKLEHHVRDPDKAHRTGDRTDREPVPRQPPSARTNGGDCEPGEDRHRFDDIGSTWPSLLAPDARSLRSLVVATHLRGLALIGNVHDVPWFA
jgi:hypothetical protein